MEDRILIDALGVGVPVDLTGVDDDVRAAIDAAWTDALLDDSDGVTETPPVTVGGASLDVELASLSTQVTLAALEAQRQRLWMLHAAALALPGGEVIVLVGPSGRGKTTASRMLAAAYGYVSDETAAIGPDGSIYPYRKPLSIIENSNAVKTQRAPSALGLRISSSEPLRLGRIVLLDRREDGPDEPAVVPVDFGDALAELVEQTSYLPRLSRPLHVMASHVDATGGVLRVVYREAETLVDLLPSLVGAATSGTLVAPRDLYVSPQPLNATSTEAERFSRIEPLDQFPLRDPDRVVLLHPSGAPGGATVRVLAGIGPTIWSRCDDATLDELVTAVVEKHGQPPAGDPATIVRDVVQRLMTDGVISRV